MDSIETLAITLTERTMELVSATVDITVTNFVLANRGFHVNEFSRSAVGDQLAEWVKMKMDAGARIVASEIAKKAEEVTMSQCMSIRARQESSFERRGQ